MDQELAQQIIRELTRFAAKECALTNQYGEVLFATNNFKIAHNPLDTKSKKAFPLIYERKKLGYLFIDENQRTVNELGAILKSMAELLIHQKYFAEILSHDEKRLDSIIYEFLKTEGIKKAELKKSLEFYGIDIERNRLAIIVEFNDESFFIEGKENSQIGDRELKIGRIKRQLQFLFSSLYTHHKENIISYIGGSDFAILKDMGDDPLEYQTEFRKTINTLFYNLSKELRADITVGVGIYRKGLKGLRESFEEAETALRFGKQNWGGGKVYHYDNFGVIAPLFSGLSEKNVSFSKEIVEKLNSHPDLLTSLKAYFESETSLAKTATKLKIHRNTLVYRLEKIQELTHLDPKVFNDAFELQLALIVDSYSKGGVK